MFKFLLTALGAVIGISIPINKYVNKQMDKIRKDK